MKRRIVSSLVSMALVGIGALRVEATTLLRKDALQLVDESEAILVGSVVDVQSIPTADSTFAFTFVTVKVERLIKGTTVESALTLRFAGGVVGDDVIEIEGVPRLDLGGRYLLFVADNGRAAVPLVGWVQGGFALVRHPRSGEEILVDHRGHALAGVDGKGWRTAALEVSGDGLMVAKPEPGVTILDQEGVRIEPLAEPALNEPASASTVLAQLERLVARRLGKPGTRTAAAVRSVSMLEIPASVQFRAQRAAGGVR